MTKYSEETLLKLKNEGHNLQPDVLNAFNGLIELVREHFSAEFEKQKALRWTNGDTYIDDRGNERSYHHMNRRHPPKSAQRPKMRKKTAEVVQVDEDGWATRTKARKSSGVVDDEEEREQFRESVKSGVSGVGLRPRPNTKNLGSSKGVDSRDAIADKAINSFNAFEALGDDDYDE